MKWERLEGKKGSFNKISLFSVTVFFFKDIERMFSESQIRYRDSSKRATTFPNSNVQPYEVSCC